MNIRHAAVVLAIILAVGGAGAASAAEKAQPKRNCFYARDVNGWAVQSDTIVNIRVGVRDIYQFELMGTCPDVRWHETLGIRSRGSNLICSGLDAEIISPSEIGPQHCPVRSIRKLTPAEITALPKGARP